MFTLLIVLVCLAGLMSLLAWGIHNRNKEAQEFEEFLASRYRRGENGKHGPPIT